MNLLITPLHTHTHTQTFSLSPPLPRFALHGTGVSQQATWLSLGYLTANWFSLETENCPLTPHGSSLQLVRGSPSNTCRGNIRSPVPTASLSRSTPTVTPHASAGTAAFTDISTSLSGTLFWSAGGRQQRFPCSTSICLIPETCHQRHGY